MKLTKEKAIKLHRELWDWLYHHPSKQKCNWPRWKDIGYVFSFCFACEYGVNCCILDWAPTIICMDSGSYYKRWNKARTPKTRKKYAKLIRDLPEK